MAAKRYFVISGSEEKGPYTLRQLREAVEQLAIADSVEVRLDGSDAREPLAPLLRRTHKPPQEAPLPQVDGAEIARQGRERSQWKTVLFIFTLLLFAMRLIRWLSH